MKFPLQISSHGVGVPVDKRVCHACHTTSTSQWRYGRTDNVLLCNACGIRWKRKNKASKQEKIRPGPKRSRSQATTADNSDTSSRSYPSSSGRPNKSKRASIEEMVSGMNMSSNYKTDSSERNHHHRHSSGRSHDRSKMDINQLMSPVEEEYRPRSKHTIAPRGSPISIQNLLNVPDDRKSRRSCSSSMSLLPRYN